LVIGYSTDQYLCKNSQYPVMASPLKAQVCLEIGVVLLDLASNIFVSKRKMMADTTWGLVDVGLVARRLRRIGSVIAYHRDTVLSVVPKE
jgi:hypothetical protein